jgi:hypothetical protein
MKRGWIVIGLVGAGASPARAGGAHATIDGDVSAGELIRQARPALAPDARAITTRSVEDSGVARAHPTHLHGAGYAIDTVCAGTYCVEELVVGGHVAIAHRAALAHLRADVSDPGHEAEVDATEVVLPQPSAAGFLSTYRVESDYAEGAAHARTSFGCETYVATTGARATLRDVVGKADAARMLAAARRALAADAERGSYVIAAASFLVPAADTVVFCAGGDGTAMHGSIAAIRVTR